MPPKKVEAVVVIEQPEQIALTESVIAQAMQLLTGNSSAVSTSSNAAGAAAPSAAGAGAATAATTSGIAPPSATSHGGGSINATASPISSRSAALAAEKQQQQPPSTSTTLSPQQQQHATALLNKTAPQLGGGNAAISCIAPNSSSSSPPVELLLAAALGVADSFTVDPHDRDTVDFALDCVHFCASQRRNSSAKKTLKMLVVMLEMRDQVHRGDVVAAKGLLRQFAASEVTAFAREAVIQTAAAEAAAASSAEYGSGFGSLFIARSDAAKDQRGGGGGGGGMGAAARSRRDNDRDAGHNASNNAALAVSAVPAALQFFSPADIGAVVDFAAFGLLQNWRLYQGAYLAQQQQQQQQLTQSLDGAEEKQKQRDIRILAPILPVAKPLPLRYAQMLAEWQAAEEQRRQAVATELKKLQDDERTALELEAKEKAALAAEEERQRQEEAAATLFFERHGTDLAVQHVQKELNDDLQVRHQALLARLAKLEEAYRISM